MQSAKEIGFWDMADNWYQRTHRLRECAEDVGRPDLQRQKALRLFMEMVTRMMAVTQMATKISYVPPPPNAQPGGISFGK